MRPPLPVVAAIIEREGLVLIAQRPPHKAQGGQWEFPGGKVEEGESPAQAIIREIREELGCEIEPLEQLPRFVHHYPALSIEMIPVHARLRADSPEPLAHEHTGLRWLKPSALPVLEMPEADLPIVRALLSQ